MNKKAMEMTVSSIVVLVLALVLIGVGIYIIYDKILKPVETTTPGLTSCASKGVPAPNGCTGMDCKLCIKLLDTDGKTYVPCCINELT